MKTLILVFLFSAAARAQIPEGVYTELLRFKSDAGVPLPTEYINKFPSLIAKLSEEAERKANFKPEKNCAPDIHVHLTNLITNNPDATVREFEDGIVRIEVTACLPKTNAASVIKILSTAEFRKKVITTIKDSYQTSGLFCEITDAPTFGQSNYCSDVRFQMTDAVAKSRSFNVWNSSVLATYDLPVYFRSIYEIAMQNDSQTVYHVVTYIRAKRLSLAQRIFAGRFISGIQSDVLKELALQLK